MCSTDLNVNELKDLWLTEESETHIKGWAFSHLKGRYTEETILPWDYKKAEFMILPELHP